MEVQIHSVSCLIEEKPGLLVNLAPWKYKKTSSKRAPVLRSALLLDRVSTTLNPGSVTAFIGTGTGHKFLLNMIALRQQEGLLSGKIQYDLVVRKEGTYRDIVLVNDLGITHFGSLTVFDYLFFGARLRISLGVVECRERARVACRVCGLEGTAKISTLTPTELRILSIAIELSSHPTLMVLLDPTAGLDAFGTLEVLKVLRAVATRTSMPTTIVFNLPTINADMFPLIDNVSIFLGNSIEYTYSLDTFAVSVLPQAASVVTEISHILLSSSPPGDTFAPSSLASTNSVSKSGTDAAMNQICDTDSTISQLLRLFDRLEELIHSTPTSSTTTTTTTTSNANSTGSSTHTIDTIIEHGKFKLGIPRFSTTLNNAHAYSHSRRVDNGIGLPYRVLKPFYVEFYILFARLMQLHWRNIVTFQLDLARIAIAGTFLGCIAYGQGNDIYNTNLVSNTTTELVDVHAYSVSGVVYALVVLSVVAASYAVYNVHNVMHCIKIETSAGIIRTYTGYMSMLCIDLTAYLIGCVIVSSITYNMISIQGSIGMYYTVLLLATVCSYSLACACAIWCTSLYAAHIIYIIISVIFLVFTGFLRYIGDVGGLWYVISLLSYTRYAYEALTTVVFSDASDKQDYLDLFGFDNSVGMCFLYIIVWIVVLQIITLWGLMPVGVSVRFTSQKNIDSKIERISIESGGSVGSDARAIAIGSVGSSAGGGVAKTGAASKHNKPQSAREYEYSSIYHSIASTIGSGISAIGGMGGIINPLLDSGDASMHGESVHNSTKQGYQPPPIPQAGNEEDETIHFDNINTLFGRHMHIHTVDEVSGGASTSSVHNVRTIPPIHTVQNTQLYSSSIRGKNKALGTNGTTNTTAYQSDIATFTSPTKQPLLYSNNSTANNTPIKAAHTTNASTSKGLFDTEYSAEYKTYQTEDSEYKHDYIPDFGTSRDSEDEGEGYSADYGDAYGGSVDFEGGNMMHGRIANTVSGVDKVTTSSIQRNTTTHETNPIYSTTTTDTTSIVPKLVPLHESLHTTLTFSRVKSALDKAADSTAARLSGVSYKVEPGTCCCVVDGMDDSSNSLLLQILAGKMLSMGKSAGVICANDQRLGENQQYLHSAYVARGDNTHLHTLTVRQALRYASYLRRGDHDSVSTAEILRHDWKHGHWPRAPELSPHYRSVVPPTSGGVKSTEVEARVREVLAMVGLESVADCRIGDPSASASTFTFTTPTTTAATSSNTPTKLLNMANLPLYKRANTRKKRMDTKIKRRSKAQYTNLSIDNTTHSTAGSADVVCSDIEYGTHDAAAAITTTDIKNASTTTTTTAANCITPAQLRCLTIAMELVNRPALVFLDDPFQGLAWHQAQQVASVLQCLARGGRTVLLTIDRPTQHTMRYLDDIVLLSSGLCVYSGPVREMADHFGNIGFERPLHFSDLDFALEVASDRGRMSLVGGKRGNTLTPEDLADLNRSLNNIKAGREEKKRELKFQTSGTATNISEPSAANNLVNHQPKSVVPVTSLPLLPTTVVSIARGFRVLLNDRALLYRTLLAYTSGGVLVGTVWYNMHDGDYHARVSVCASSYLCVSMLLVDCVDGIYARKEAFKRELLSNATSHGAYFLSDAVPLYFLYTIACGLFCLPMYCLSGLRAEAGPFWYFLLLTLLAVYCNLSLCYALSMQVQSKVACKVVYCGVLLPLQLLFSGFVVLKQCMPNWLSWGVYVCPMYYYLSGVFRNEFLGNTAALDGVEYTHLSYQYSYYSTRAVCVLALLVVFVVYQVLLLCSLRIYGMSIVKPRAVLTRVHGVKRKAKKLIKAGLRWRESDKHTKYHTANTASVHGNVNSTHERSTAYTQNNNNMYRTSFNGILEEEDEVSEIEFGNAFYVPQYQDK